MELDMLRYTEVFDRFLNRMADSPDCKAVEEITEICRMLHISSICVYFEEHRDNVMTIISDGDADGSRMIKINVTAANGRAAVFEICPVKDSPSWSGSEREKINTFIRMLTIFHGRTKLIQYAEHVDNFDSELGIPNMNYMRRIAKKLFADGSIQLYTICCFNLRRFSVINQRLGRDAATKVMIRFITGLQEKLGDDGLICRVGSDNFVALFKDELTDDTVKHLNSTSVICDDEDENEKVIVSASSGYYVINENAKDLSEVMEKALTASQTARNTVGTHYVFFDEKLQNKKAAVNKIESLFGSALENEEFLVYYQPKVMLKTYRLAGAEALCRWKHDGKLIPPNDFIPVLEQSSAICDLDFYMLEHVCRDIRRWIDSGQNAVRVSINLSRRHMGDPKLLEKILTIIDNYRIPHHLIEIELTETTTDIEFNDLKQIVTGLHNEGIHTSVDDFGVGYSSLNLIRQVPWNVIKIDKSFLPEKLQSDSAQYIMFSHLLSMIRGMGLKCIVEGVETVEQVRILKENNCYLAQGYYFDKPLEVSEFEKRLSAISE